MDGLDGNLCVGLFYEHRFAMLINTKFATSLLNDVLKNALLVADDFP